VIESTADIYRPEEYSVNYNSDTHHEDPSAAAPQPKAGMSRAKAQRRKGKNESELGVLGVLARE
jgi:hypothetical protein